MENNKNKILYALAKQLPYATAISSNYGVLELDDELRRAMEAAVAPILKQRLKSAEKYHD